MILLNDCVIGLRGNHECGRYITSKHTAGSPSFYTEFDESDPWERMLRGVALICLIISISALRISLSKNQHAFTE